MFWKIFTRAMGITFFCPPDDGGGATPPDPKANPPAPPAGDPAALLAARDARIAELEAKLKGGNPPAGGDTDPDLAGKSARNRQDQDRSADKMKQTENAIRFEMQSENWLKTNESLLPKTVKDIFETAKKETFADAVEKDRELKSGIVQEFFKVQENIDRLTGPQRAELDQYLKLTKAGKNEKALQMYDSIFEPAFESLKREKKAALLAGGFGGDIDAGYKAKLQKGSAHHYLGEKR